MSSASDVVEAWGMRIEGSDDDIIVYDDEFSRPSDVDGNPIGDGAHAAKMPMPRGGTITFAPEAVTVQREIESAEPEREMDVWVVASDDKVTYGPSVFETIFNIFWII